MQPRQIILRTLILSPVNSVDNFQPDENNSPKRFDISSNQYEQNLAEETTKRSISASNVKMSRILNFFPECTGLLSFWDHFKEQIIMI